MRKYLYKFVKVGLPGTILVLGINGNYQAGIIIISIKMLLDYLLSGVIYEDLKIEGELRVRKNIRTDRDCIICDNIDEDKNKHRHK